MKTFKALFTILILAGSSLLANTCSDGPITYIVNSSSVTNTEGAQDISSLDGTDCSSSTPADHFKILSLPSANSGVLYMADGTTAVTLNQVLTREEADGLRFNPSSSFVGNATFTYGAIVNGAVDLVGETVTIPVVSGNENGNGGHPGNGNACAEAPTTDNIDNPNLLNTLGATDISALSGKNCANTEVNKFKIITLPSANSGVLYTADGKRVVEGQELTKKEADGLKFDPKAGFAGNATFTYIAIDENGEEDTTPATVTIPVSAGNGNGNGGHPGNGNGNGGHPGNGNGNGNVCTEAPTTENIDNPNLLNTLGAVNILNLSGEDCNGHAVEQFRIVTLPDAAAGTLYMADGVTAVTVGQTLTRAEADGLRFDPMPDFVGDATFTYAAIDANGNVDATPATVTIPVTNHGAAGDCTCDDYETSVPSLSMSSLLALVLLISATGIFFARREELN